MKKELGFGLMRLPRNLDGTIKLEESQRLVDFYMAHGGHYFDTGYHYLNGLGEKVIKLLLTDKYPRELYKVTAKFPTWINFEDEARMENIFQGQLNNAGLTYFDNYFLHGISDSDLPEIESSDIFNFLKRLKDEDRVKKVGFSFHGTPECLRLLLDTYGNLIDIVQIQYNYLDQTNPLVSSKLNYILCEQYNKEVYVMEPCKGGLLINLPEEDIKLLENNDFTPNQYALTFAAMPKNVSVVLSGMDSLIQVHQNLHIFNNFKPLTVEELELSDKIIEHLYSMNITNCTNCKYCLSKCEKHVNIPLVLSLFENIKTMSANEVFRVLNSNREEIIKGNFDKCVNCAKCESICPQHIKISNYTYGVKTHPVFLQEMG